LQPAVAVRGLIAVAMMEVPKLHTLLRYSRAPYLKKIKAANKDFTKFLKSQDVKKMIEEPDTWLPHTDERAIAMIRNTITMISTIHQSMDQSRG